MGVFGRIKMASSDNEDKTGLSDEEELNDSKLNSEEDQNDDSDYSSSKRRKRGKKRKAKESKKSNKKKKKRKNDSDSDAEIDPAQPKGRKSKGGKTEQSEQSNDDMPTVAEVCENFGLTDVDLEYSDADYQNLTTYKLFQQTYRQRIQAANPKVPQPKLMMLVAAKWREFQSNGESAAAEDDIPEEDETH